MASKYFAQKHSQTDEPSYDHFGKLKEGTLRRTEKPPPFQLFASTIEEKTQKGKKG